jgi:PAS domain S-box-containing protein
MENTTTNHTFPFRLFFLLFAAIALLILAGAWYVGEERINGELELARSHEIGTVVMGVRRLDDELHAPFYQLRTLVKEKAVRQAIDASGKLADPGMAAAFASLLAFNEMYDKVRWIDQTGMERVRVNEVAGRPEIVPADKLRNQSGSYYFTDAMRLKPGQVFISPLDLNVERGKVEIPHKPMLRLATPVQDDNGEARGILILDVAAQYFLDSFTDSLIGARDRAMLLNSAGYWLVSPHPEDAWGFMFQNGKNLGSAYPEAWKAINRIPSGEMEDASGLWIWSTAYPLKVSDTRAIAEIPRWLVVSHLPGSELAAIRKDVWSAIGINTLALLTLFGILAAWLARALSGRTRAKVEAAKAHAEAAVASSLAEARNRFRLVVEANTNGLLVVDKTGRIVLANPALERMFGYGPGELLGQALEILLPESVRLMHGEQFTSFMDSPTARPMGSGRDLNGRRKDASVFPVEISLSPFTENGESYVDAFVADISERKRIEALHRQSEAHLRLLLQTNPNGLLVLNNTGRIQMTNPALDEMFGYAPGELLDESMETLVPMASHADKIRMRAQYMEHPAIRTMGVELDLNGVRKNGCTFPIEVSLSSFDEDGRTFAQATIVDTTRRQAANRPSAYF